MRSAAGRIHRASPFALNVWFAAAALARLLVSPPSLLPGAAAKPDLTITFNNKKPYIECKRFDKDDCAVDEGCVNDSGMRKLLRFDTETVNKGSSDLYFGDPKDDPDDLYEWHGCHKHYHFEKFAHYRLADMDGDVVEEGNKAGFCLQDSKRLCDPDDDDNCKEDEEYDCNNQGISAGWSDVYKAKLDCQWIDITDVKPGTYMLEMEVNFAGVIREKTRSNNVAEIKVRIPDESCDGGDDDDDDDDDDDSTSGGEDEDEDEDEDARPSRSDYCSDAEEDFESDELDCPDEDCPNSGCKKCRGDCDNDDMCRGDLKCCKRDAYEPVPGCDGYGKKGWDYCYDPTDGMCDYEGVSR